DHPDPEPVRHATSCAKSCVLVHDIIQNGGACRGRTGSNGIAGEPVGWDRMNVYRGDGPRLMAAGGAMERAHRRRNDRDPPRQSSDGAPPRVPQTSDHASSTEHDLLRLQRATGNQVVQRLVTSRAIPPSGPHAAPVDLPVIRRSPKKKKKPVTKVVYVTPNG